MGQIRSQIIETIKGNIEGAVLPSEPLSKHNTYQVGGVAEIFVSAWNSDETAWVYRYAKRNRIPVTILGAGSNVIVPDDGIDGIVLKAASPDAVIRFPGGGRVLADAGIAVVELARLTARKGLRGLESIAGVPGTIGGAVLMNAQVDRDDTASLLSRVEVLTSSGRHRILYRKEIGFGYRKSMFQATDWLILRAEFRLKPGDPDTVLQESDEEWRKWRSKFPLDPPNAGSVFKRPEGDFAGRLIEEAGCKGLQIGGARVSDRHANFICNTGDATALDILTLISEVRRRVYQNTGVYLEMEQIVLPSNRK